MTNADDFVSAEFNQVGERTLSNGGLTKREYFAALAMQGMLSKSAGRYPTSEIINDAIGAADALIKELNT